MTRVPVGVLVLAVPLAVLLAGCGDRAATLPDRLDGSTVARMAERQLEVQNARLAPGTLSCPDLVLRVGASVHCLRTTELTGGRVVKVAGTVTVTSRASGGRLHVAMDDHAREFGLTGQQLVAGVRDRYRQRFGKNPSRLHCPYLRGVVGARVTCRLEVAGVRHAVEVVVTAVDPSSFGTSYALHVGGPRR